MKQLPFAEACERNKGPILEKLRGVLPSRGRILEIGSGTGQHLAFFAPQFPDLQWQPSDCRENLGGLAARISREASPNVLPPIELDVLGKWPDQLFDAVYSANTAHIMAWNAVCAMFAGLELHLAPGGVFFLYGPFIQDARCTAASNEEFDRQLRERSPEMGLRDVEALESLAQRQRMILVRRYSMPANNHVLVFMRIEVPGNE